MNPLLCQLSYAATFAPLYAISRLAFNPFSATAAPRASQNAPLSVV